MGTSAKILNSNLVQVIAENDIVGFILFFLWKQFNKVISACLAEGLCIESFRLGILQQECAEKQALQHFAFYQVQSSEGNANNYLFYDWCILGIF